VRHEVGRIARLDLGHHPQQETLRLEGALSSAATHHGKLVGDCPALVLRAGLPDRVVIGEQARGDGCFVPRRAGKLERLGRHWCGTGSIVRKQMGASPTASRQNLGPQCTICCPQELGIDRVELGHDRRPLPHGRRVAKLVEAQ
jgi:hypothetical protein